MQVLTLFQILGFAVCFLYKINVATSGIKNKINTAINSSKLARFDASIITPAKAKNPLIPKAMPKIIFLSGEITALLHSLLISS